MKIGELAKRSGLTASRIRFYESSGLIKSVDRKSNGYRDYGPDALWILEVITGAQSAGFSLDEIRHLLPVEGHTWQRDELVDSLKRKVAEIGLLQKRLPIIPMDLCRRPRRIRCEHTGIPFNRKE